MVESMEEYGGLVVAAAIQHWLWISYNSSMVQILEILRFFLGGGGISISILSADIVFDAVQYGRIWSKRQFHLPLLGDGDSGGGVRAVIVSHVQFLNTRFILLNMYNKLIDSLILNLVEGVTKNFYPGTMNWRLITRCLTFLVPQSQ